MFKPTDAELRASGGLTNTFFHCDTCLTDEDFNRLRHKAFIEEETHILRGLFSNSVDGVMARGAVADNTASKQTENRQTKERRTAQIIEWVEQIRSNIERMKADIKALEDLFRQRDGDAWREELALRIFSEDDIPQQESGETIHAYRERLEIWLIEQLLNDDGSIKDEYKNHPELADYAQWAQQQYHTKNAEALVAELDDNDTSPQRRTQILDKMRGRGYIEEINFADRAAQNKDTQVSMRDLADDQRDELLSHALSSDTAMKFTS